MKIIILALFLVTSCQSQKLDTIVFRNNTKIKVYVVDRSIAYVRYVFPDDSMIHASRTRNIKVLKYARQQIGFDGTPVDKINYLTDFNK